MVFTNNDAHKKKNLFYIYEKVDSRRVESCNFSFLQILSFYVLPERLNATKQR